MSKIKCIRASDWKDFSNVAKVYFDKQTNKETLQVSEQINPWTFVTYNIVRFNPKDHGFARHPQLNERIVYDNVAVFDNFIVFEDKPSKTIDFSDLEGKKILNIIVSQDKTEVYIKVIDDQFQEEFLKIYHLIDSCEQVYLEDITEDYKDILINQTIISAEESIDDSRNAISEEESETWTFYKLKTKEGYVDMRWYGSSNGWYSESVTIEKMSMYETLEYIYFWSNF